MGRNGKGDSWKHRWYRPHGLSGIRRNYVKRELKIEPQYRFEDLYIMPFRERRIYSEDGKVSYVPIEQQRKLTGIHIFDAYVEYLAQCNSDINAFVDRYGLKVTDIDSLVFVLTGMRGVDFRQKYQVQIADDLLRYTDLTIAEVAKRTGIGSPNNLYLTYKRGLPSLANQAGRRLGAVQAVWRFYLLLTGKSTR